MSEENLFTNFVIFDEKILVSLGFWPVNNWKNTIWCYVHIFIQLTFFILVVVKNFSNPEKGSVENALVLSVGGLIMVVYFITLMNKKEKYIELLHYVKLKQKSKLRPQEREFLNKIGHEFRKIAKGSLFVLASAFLIRLFLPPFEIVYIKLFANDRTYKLPPSMGFPVFSSPFANILVYIFETFMRLHILGSVVAICSIFILTTLHISYKYFSLSLNLEFYDKNDDDVINGFIIEHNRINKMAKILNKIFWPFFFSNCVVSFMNCSLCLFSIMANNASLKTSIVELPLLTTGMGQLFFLLYFGDRLIDAVRILKFED
ncbi:hypothetical protein PVAND_017063 [Polypedilum vanderplanki]|uniref:Odorant receptor n=1 Tax=Polypedilum vanderplanki TaxID=319348 RepID=A0A9J6BHM7_POLVA|nr:hypothetical protein PVAND_017063 [Polypedilum vanderplanki]